MVRVDVGTGRDLSVHYPDNNPNIIQNWNSESENKVSEYRMELNQYGQIVKEIINWLASQYQYIDIHNYVIMPNHFHFILEINSQKTLDSAIKIKTL